MREEEDLVLAAGIVFATGVLVWRSVGNRQDPEETERRRRLAIRRDGRMNAAIVIDRRDDVLFYTYSIAGVDYTASQDISSLRQLVPGQLDGLIGPATVKYVPKNPFNSILICEEWTGFRKHRRFKQGA